MTKDDGVVSTTEVVDTRRAGSKRRVWPEALKRQLVAETAEPGQSVSLVARRHDVNANLLFKWRRSMPALGKARPVEGLLPVTITPSPVLPAPSFGMIEIDLGEGRKMRVEGMADPALVRTALEVLTATDRHR